MGITKRRHAVILTGAGISAESGIKTFRDSAGLWEGHSIADVATPGGWKRNPERVLQFYNERRRQILKSEPNAAHLALVALEEAFDVSIVTQNVDDLHERAGSKMVLHLHGEIRKSRSTKNQSCVYPIEGNDLVIGDCCEAGSQLRPHIVWFGEEVPLLPEAENLARDADIGIIVGTSMQVYPAANLMHEFGEEVPVYYIDPQPAAVARRGMPVTVMAETAVEGVPKFVAELMSCA